MGGWLGEKGKGIKKKNPHRQQYGLYKGEMVGGEVGMGKQGIHGDGKIFVLFSSHTWESAVAEDLLCALIYAILYRKLESPQVLVSARGARVTPVWILRDSKVVG